MTKTKELASICKRMGHDVRCTLDGWEDPEPVNGVKPDIAAFKDGKTLLIYLGDDQEKIKKLKEYADEHEKVKLRLKDEE